MNRLPLLPFACSIAGGEQHAGLLSKNETVFNKEYFAKLYKMHKDDIPQVLTEKLTRELKYYMCEDNKDLIGIMFGRLLEDDAHGIVCVPVGQKDKKTLTYVTIVYRFCHDENTLEMDISLMGCEADKEDSDVPFIKFTAERIPNSFDIGIDIPADVTIPVMLRCGYSYEQLVEVALRWVRFVCAFEMMFIYKCVPFTSYWYNAMLTKKGTFINPNYVSVNLLACEGEEKNIP